MLSCYQLRTKLKYVKIIFLIKCISKLSCSKVFTLLSQHNDYLTDDQQCSIYSQPENPKDTYVITRL